MKFLREIFSEPDSAGGGLSYGRIASGLALIAAIAWITHLILLTHAIPPMDGITAFVVGPYGANKFGTMIQGATSKAVTKASS